MAQINFPTATANGQQFEADNGVIYTYVGTPPNGYWSGTFQNQSYSTLDGRYLKLDSSNDPLTSGLNITGGNVGIGTTSPAQKLEVAGVNPRLRITDTDSSASSSNSYLEFFGNDARSSIIYNTPTGLTLQTETANADGHIIFNTLGGNEKVRIASDGDVCIGVTNLSTLGAVNSPALGIGGASGNRLGIYGNGGRWWYMHGETPNTLTFGARVSSNTADSDVITLNSDGNVGIGTTATGAKLVVRGESSTDKVAVHITAGNSASTVGLIVDGDNEAGDVLIRARSNATPTTSTPTDADTKFLVLGNGNVGIGATNPEAKLEVVGNAYIGGETDTYVAIYNESAGSSEGGSIEAFDKDDGSVKRNLFLNAWGGNVGIRTNNPGTQLEVKGDIGIARDQGSYTFRETVGGSERAGIHSNNNNDLIFKTGAATEEVRVRSGGGITFNGDTAAANALDDYEEGTWTPAFTGGTFTYTNQTGKYTKIGDLVYLSAVIAWSAKSGTSNLSSAIPFTTKGSAGNDRYVGTIGYVAGVDNGGERQLTASISGDRTGVGFFLLRDNNTPTATTVQSASTSGEIQFSFVVKVQ